MVYIYLCGTETGSQRGTAKGQQLRIVLRLNHFSGLTQMKEESLQVHYAAISVLVFFSPPVCVKCSKAGVKRKTTGEGRDVIVIWFPG